jgi:hypothetical protein
MACAKPISEGTKGTRASGSEAGRTFTGSLIRAIPSGMQGLLVSDLDLGYTETGKELWL